MFEELAHALEVMTSSVVTQANVPDQSQAIPEGATSVIMSNTSQSPAEPSQAPKQETPGPGDVPEVVIVQSQPTPPPPSPPVEDNIPQDVNQEDTNG